MSATNQRDARCARCGERVALVDEHDRCEQCVLGAEHAAAHLTEYIEGTVADLLRDRLVTTDQLRALFELTLANAAGTVPGTLLARQPVTTLERGVCGRWHRRLHSWTTTKRGWRSCVCAAHRGSASRRLQHG